MLQGQGPVESRRGLEIPVSAAHTNLRSDKTSLGIERTALKRRIRKSKRNLILRPITEDRRGGRTVVEEGGDNWPGRVTLESVLCVSKRKVIVVEANATPNHPIPSSRGIICETTARAEVPVQVVAEDVAL